MALQMSKSVLSFLYQLSERHVAALHCPSVLLLEQYTKKTDDVRIT
jgi:hypothetical protein